jgi:hypothetical protein
MPEKKVDKETLFKELDAMSGMEQSKAISIIMDKYNYKESTAAMYYAQWRKEFKKPGYKMHNKSKKQANLSEIEDSEELKLNRKAIKEVVANQQSINKESVIVDRKEDKQIYGTIDANFIQRGMLREPIKFIPVVFKGKYFEYKITKDGLKINSGIQDIITQDCIEEQQEALKLWEKYKEVI